MDIKSCFETVIYQIIPQHHTDSSIIVFYHYTIKRVVVLVLRQPFKVIFYVLLKFFTKMIVN